MSKKSTGVLAALTLAAAGVAAFFLSKEENRAKVKAELNKAGKKASEFADDILESDEVEGAEKKLRTKAKKVRTEIKEIKKDAKKIARKR